MYRRRFFYHGYEENVEEDLLQMGLLTLHVPLEKM
jgi:hypothetical protein